MDSKKNAELDKTNKTYFTSKVYLLFEIRIIFHKLRFIYNQKCENEQKKVK